MFEDEVSKSAQIEAHSRVLGKKFGSFHLVKLILYVIHLFIELFLFDFVFGFELGINIIEVRI
jgi:hypothetical protein